MAAVIGVSGEQAASAQGQFPGRPSINVQAFNACTTTNYGDIAAKALNTTSAAIRKALVGGQTLQQIAAAANVDLKTVSDAISAARKTEINQAVTDGVLTQAESTALEATYLKGTAGCAAGFALIRGAFPAAFLGIAETCCTWMGGACTP